MDNANKAAVDNQVTSVGANNPVGLAQKEQAPPISPKVKLEISKIIEASGKEPEIPTEVREAGVEQVSDGLPLTDEHKAVGIEHAKESTPFPTQPSGLVNVPAIDEAKRDLKISPVYSVRWLAELRKRVLKMFGLWKEK